MAKKASKKASVGKKKRLKGEEKEKKRTKAGSPRKRRARASATTKKKKKKKKDEVKEEEPSTKWPVGITPIFLAEKGLERMNMKTGDNIEDCVDHKVLEKEEVMKEIKEFGFMSDFHSIREQIKGYQGDQILLVSDRESVYGQNYYWCSSLETFNDRLKRISNGEGGDNASIVIEDQIDEEEKERLRLVKLKEEEEEKKLLTYVEKSLVARPWKSAGSENEIEAMTIKNSRPLIKLKLSRKIRHFASAKKVQFSDLDPEECTEIRSENSQGEASERAVRSKGIDIGLQGVNPVTEAATQTLWRRKVNKAVQYAPVDLDQKTKHDLLKGTKMEEFIKRVASRCILALQQNETNDIFSDEFSCFETEDQTVGTAAADITELHSFIDLKYSKDKKLSCIDWQPKGNDVHVVAVSCCLDLSFDERVDISGKTRKSTIILWNFRDLINPELILTSPVDVYCFQYNPDDADVIVAGLESGQVAVWELTDVVRNKINGKRGSNTAGDDEGKSKRTLIGEKKISYIERSHSKSVTDIAWLPKDIMVTRERTIKKVIGGESTKQFVTLASDGVLLFWDIRDAGLPPTQTADDDDDGHNSSDTKWLPRQSVILKSPINSKSLSGVRMCLGEEADICLITEDGELVFGSWRNIDDTNTQQSNGLEDLVGEEEEEEERKTLIDEMINDDRNGSSINNNIHLTVVMASAHNMNLSSSTIQRSPHFSDIFLTVSDWCFAIWKQSVDTPIFQSPRSTASLITARWSPTRPAVIVTAKSDGTIDVWDLLDQSHKPVVHNWPVASTPLSSMQFHQSEAARSPQYLAVGDKGGNLHILEIPQSYKNPLNNEAHLVDAFYGREIQRDKYVTSRKAKSIEYESKQKPTRLIQKRQEKKTAEDLTATIIAERRNRRGFRRKEEEEKVNDTACAADRKDENAFQMMLERFKKELGVHAS